MWPRKFLSDDDWVRHGFGLIQHYHSPRVCQLHLTISLHFVDFSSPHRNARLRCCHFVSSLVVFTIKLSLLNTCTERERETCRHQNPTKQQLYGHPIPLSKTIQIRWTRHVGPLLEKQGRTDEWLSLTDLFRWTCQCWPTDKNLPTTALYGRKMSWRPAGSDGW